LVCRCTKLIHVYRTNNKTDVTRLMIVIQNWKMKKMRHPQRAF